MPGNQPAQAGAAHHGRERQNRCVGLTGNALTRGTPKNAPGHHTVCAADTPQTYAGQRSKIAGVMPLVKWLIAISRQSSCDHRVTISPHDDRVSFHTIRVRPRGEEDGYSPEEDQALTALRDGCKWLWPHCKHGSLLHQNFGGAVDYHPETSHRQHIGGRLPSCTSACPCPRLSSGAKGTYACSVVGLPSRTSPRDAIPCTRPVTLLTPSSLWLRRGATTELNNSSAYMHPRYHTRIMTTFG